MSYFTLALHAYDVMDRVHVTVEMREHSDNPLERSQSVLHADTTIQGTGEDDARQWAIDALVGMIESL